MIAIELMNMLNGLVDKYGEELEVMSYSEDDIGRVVYHDPALFMGEFNEERQLFEGNTGKVNCILI